MTKVNEKRRFALIICASAILINLALFFVKLYIGIRSGSLCIFTDSINNLLDCFSAIIACIGFGVLSDRPNPKYPFGLGRAEDIVTFFISILVALTGAAFAYSSIERMFYPTPVWFSVKYAAVICATIVVKALMAVMFFLAYKKYNSPVLYSMKLDSILDCFISLATVISFTLSEYIGYSVDGIVGIIISIMIIIGGIKLLVSAVRRLMGRRNDDLCEKVASTVRCCRGVENIISVECHSYGTRNTFSVCVSTTCDSIEDFKKMNEDIKRKVSEKFSSEISISIGG